MLSAYSCLSMALDFGQMVLEVQKNPKPTQFYILNNLCFNNFPKKSIPGNARGQVLQEPVRASHDDQGQKSGAPRTFLDPGGQAGSDGTPHLGFGSSPRIPQGGRCLNIYKDKLAGRFYMLNIFCLNNFTKKSSSGGVLALGLLLAVYGPGLGPDGPGGPENLKPTKFYVLNIFGFNKFPQKSSPGVLLNHQYLFIVSSNVSQVFPGL